MFWTARVSPREFLIAAAHERAKHVLAESECLTPTPKDWDRFFTALDSTGPPRR